MARIRSIKPEFPQSESMGRVSRDARLLFVMLWPICDDHGRTRAASRMLASLLFPYDDDAPKLMDGWLDELEREGCIRRYVVDGSAYLEVCNWLKHQKIDKPSKPLFPAFDEGSANTREGSRILPVGKEGKGEEGSGKEPPNPPDGGQADAGQRKAKTDGLAKIAADAVAAFNASPLVKPNGGLLASVNPNVGGDLRQRQVSRAIKLAREIAGAMGTPLDREWWAGYFEVCAADDWTAGRAPRGKEHAGWEPDFEYLTRPKVMDRMFRRAASEAE